MKKHAGIMIIIAVMVVGALCAGCVTQTIQATQKPALNQTPQCQVSPSDEKRPLPPDQTLLSANADPKNGNLNITGNFTAESVTCILQTKNNAECKDCCDCLEGNATTRKNCRDACFTHDFSLNTNFITVSPLSVLGPQGDYSVCAGAGSEQACKECCDGSSSLSCGDRRFCRDVCNAMGQGSTPPTSS